MKRMRRNNAVGADVVVNPVVIAVAFSFHETNILKHGPMRVNL
jgi:hypothetical protein